MSATVKKSTVEKYSIRNDGEYATICITEWGPDQRASGSNYYGGEIMINSSYGAFANAWSACGEPFKKFLIGIEMDYFMGKCLGRGATVFDGSASYKAAVARVLDARRNNDLSKEDARELYDELEYCQSELEDSEASFTAAIYRVPSNGDQSRVFDEAYEMLVDMPNPQAVGFWKKLWPAFEAELKNELLALTEGATP